MEQKQSYRNILDNSAKFLKPIVYANVWEKYQQAFGFEKLKPKYKYKTPYVCYAKCLWQEVITCLLFSQKLEVFKDFNACLIDSLNQN